MRGHGASERPDSLAACTFPNVTGDVLAVIDALGFDEIVALGHSMGGAVAILLDELRPGIVRKALLCEAIAFPPGGLPRTATGGPNPMSEIARSAPRGVARPRDGRASYASRPPMNVLEPDALAAYVQYGFRDRDDGQVELACAPEVEARCFEAAAEPEGALHAFGHLADFGGSLVVASGDHSNLPGNVFAAQAEAAGGALPRARRQPLLPPGGHRADGRARSAST